MEEIRLTSAPPASLAPKEIKPINHLDKDTKRMVVVLCKASLETIKIGSKKNQDAKFELLNSDDHKTVIKKMKKDVSDARPDITHQCLLSLLDSPINKAGKLNIYIQTEKNVLIEINPCIRIPRTFRRFCGLMVQLLHKFSISSVDSKEKLMRVIKNPITDHLPIKCRKVTLSYDEKTTNVCEYIKNTDENESICFFVGAISKGPDNFADEYVDEKISISHYQLSAAVTCSKLCHGCEDAWNIT